ncbi:hypothetical protein ACVWYH_009213 [Bradyrhizobium sp. GM24.11]
MNRTAFALAGFFFAAVFSLSCAFDTAHADWQFTRWGMSPGELVQLGQGNIRPSRGESTPNGGGTTMAVDADLALASAYNAEGVKYQALYYFKADRLILVALIPQSVEDGFKTGKLLDATYGAPDREESMGRDENHSGCIVRRRWRAQSDGNLVTFFNLCGTRFEVRYESIPAKGGL